MTPRSVGDRLQGNPKRVRGTNHSSQNGQDKYQ